MSYTTLYRPTGLQELLLIIESGWKRFPPRLEWQPIFYPVTNQKYADQIAAEWNTKDAFSGFCGIVTKFVLETQYLSKYPIQNVGGSYHNELWIPANELNQFNEHIIGEINVVSVFFGNQFTLPENELLADELLKFRR